MIDTRDAKQRPLTYALLSGIISGITRTVLSWLINQLSG
jgi:hypothetical protein